MLDARTNVWLSRLQGNGPRWVVWLLAALIVLELGHLVYAMAVNPVKSPQPLAPAAGAGNQRPAADVQQVIAAHLFGIATAEPGSQDPANAPLSSANLLLTGTIATQDPRHGVAIASDAGGPSKVYSVGDRLAGASLHSVYLDHVILDRNGALETVVLPRLLRSGPGAGPAMRRPGGDPRAAAAVDNIRRMVQQDPTILDQVMRTVPSYDNAAGKLRGFRAFPGKNRQIFAKLGLKSGDLVTAINGTPLDDPQRSQEVFNTIQTSDHVTVTVERGGQKQDISLNIAQVAAQATQELESPQSAAPPGAAPSGAAPQVPNDAQAPPVPLPPGAAPQVPNDAQSPPMPQPPSPVAPDATAAPQPNTAPPLPHMGPPPPDTPPNNDNSNP
jgi:general secretion pathway protein C